MKIYWAPTWSLNRLHAVTTNDDSNKRYALCSAIIESSIYMEYRIPDPKKKIPKCKRCLKKLDSLDFSDDTIN